MGLLTTTVGSFPKPRALRRARRLFAEGDLDREALREEEDRAVSQVLALQERLGLSLPTDGEMTRGDLVDHYAGCWDGLEAGMLVRCWGNRYVRRPRVTGPIERRSPAIVEDWKRTQSRSERPVRACVTGPYTLMHWSFDEHYATRRECAGAFAVAVADEVAALAAAGATEIQLDEPAFGVVPDESGWATELVTQVAAGRGEARLWGFVAFGDPNPDWETLARLPLDCLLIGAAYPRAASDPGIGSLPEEMRLGAGVVDGIDSTVEPAGEVRARIEALLERVPAERLIPSVSSGLRGLSRESAEAKVRVLVEAASAF